MPILKFYTSPGQLTDAEKQELATELTSRYATMMPAFFVNIMFHEVCLILTCLSSPAIPHSPFPDHHFLLLLPCCLSFVHPRSKSFLIEANSSLRTPSL